ncbi:hypothetical protein BDB00DRAFT_939456 [Zychaea mexicana]|uniref:uncharacterized protein n=1 Tax=Zychaea mexicana TaxID=64656 RepID=UPI0022FDB335|nr:uncharacterized protein BDB00DRAFT_939456 [Zychaea mexicana]KAI9492696.1 hypothetical protein BDB00DRAFT_939456 [Zychaea mexicana]
MVHSKFLLSAVLSTLAYHMADAAPMAAGSDVAQPLPILHLSDAQLEQFKHASPDQPEPDIAFPKNAEGLYADGDAVPEDTEATEMGIELNSIGGTVNTMETEALIVGGEEQNDEGASNEEDDEEEEVIQMAAAPADNQQEEEQVEEAQQSEEGDTNDASGSSDEILEAEGDAAEENEGEEETVDAEADSEDVVQPEEEEEVVETQE